MWEPLPPYPVKQFTHTGWSFYPLDFELSHQASLIDATNVRDVNVNNGFDPDHLQVIDDILNQFAAIKMEDFPDEDFDESLCNEINGHFRNFHGGVSLDDWFRSHRKLLKAEFESPTPPPSHPPEPFLPVFQVKLMPFLVQAIPSLFGGFIFLSLVRLQLTNFTMVK